jgi:hypothetical protein
MFPLALTKRDEFPLVHPAVERRLADPKPVCDLTGRHAMLSPLCEDSFVESVAMRAVNVRAAYRWKYSRSRPVLQRQVCAPGPAQVIRLRFLHLPIFRSYTLIEFFHYGDEGNIFLPEWRIISVLLNQNRRNG